MNEIKELKKKTIGGMLWKFAERFIAQGVSLVVSIVLARLLTPDDYSVVGIVGIFFSFANLFISAGFNTALIQKKEVDAEDYSSVLFISLISATVLYLIIFFCAPYIANAYGKEILTIVFRVMGITLFINAIKSVVCAYISRHLQFRKFFFVTIIGTVISAVVGIVMAVKGFGPWALVAQQMTNSVIDTILLYATTRIKFVFRISRSKTKSLFGYSWKLLVAGLINTAYDEANPLIIGLRYSPADLSYYSKGKSFPSTINSTIGNSLSAVLFPSMAKLQDDKVGILTCTRRFMQTSSFFIFPMMIGFLSLADKFVLVLLTEKWASATIYLQVFCLVYMFNMIQDGNLQVVRAIGKSGLFLIMEIIKKSSYLIVILLFVLFTDKPEHLAIACIVNTCIATLVNTFPNRKLIGYKYRLQIIDLLPNLVMSIIMGVTVYLVGLINLPNIALIFMQVVDGVIVYVLLCLITKNKTFYYCLRTAKEYLKKNSQKESLNENNQENS